MIEQIKMGVTLDEMKQYGEDHRVEVVNGELKEIQMAAGYIHTTLIENLYDLLKPFVKANKLGVIKIDGLNFLLSMVAETVRSSRIPDLSFIRHENIPESFNRASFDNFPGAPDLAVEVVSPSEDLTDLDEKITDYFAAGTEQLWAVYALQQKVHVYLREENLNLTERTYHIYKSGDTLEAPTLFPGLKIALVDIFQVEE